MTRNDFKKYGAALIIDNHLSGEKVAELYDTNQDLIAAFKETAQNEFAPVSEDYVPFWNKEKPKTV